MKKHILKRILIAFVIAIPLAIIVKITYFPVIYPTRSTSNTLSFVCYDVGYSNKPVITIKHYVNSIHICDYILEIKTGIHIQEPQSYELPELDNGVVEISVEFDDEINSSFTLTYDAEDFYQRGILIYTDLGNHYNNNNQFVCFVSGKETVCYSRATDYDEFTIETGLPSLKAIPAKENPGFVSIYSGWKENEWVIENNNN